MGYRARNNEGVLSGMDTVYFLSLANRPSVFLSVANRAGDGRRRACIVGDKSVNIEDEMRGRLT